MIPNLFLSLAIAAQPTTTITSTLSESHFDYAALPLFNYSSDTGFGFGIRGMVQRIVPSAKPYQLSLEAQGFGTTGGVQFHFLSLDAPQILGSPYRLDILAGYYRNIAAPYEGIGNHPARAIGHDLYQEETPLLRLRVRRALLDRIWAIIGYRFLLEVIRFDSSSLLAHDAPLGIAGGRYSELALGIAWDTRDHEMLPRHGVLLEATLRTTQTFIGSSYIAYGAFASGAIYEELTSGLVVAARIAVDATIGDVPFDRLQDFGSLITPFFVLNGIGGGLSVRGLGQSEYIGSAKAFANLELRHRLFAIDILGNAFTLYGLAFVDAGRVWSGPDPTDITALGIHAGAGGGLRIAWGEYFVLRADAGYAEGSVRMYADFRHIF